MSKSESERNPLTIKAAEAQAAAARLAKLVQTHAELLAAKTVSSWHVNWVGGIVSGMSCCAFTNVWDTGSGWAKEAHFNGDDWNAWATGTWLGEGEFYENPNIYYGKPVWANLICGGFGAGGASLSLYASQGGPLIGKFGAYFQGTGGCNISHTLDWT